MKFTAKLKELWAYVPKRAAAVTLAVAGVVAAVTIPVVTGAWGPNRDTYTIEKPADHVTFNSITNNPSFGDERNFLSVRDTDSKYWDSSKKNGWGDVQTLQEGHTYEIMMYVHNNAASNLNLEATNVRAHISELPAKEDTFGKEFQVNAFLWADNAKPKEIWDNVILKSDKAFHVKVVSKKYYNNIRNEGSSNGFDLGDELITSSGQGTGSLLGYKQMDGKIPGCFQYSGFVKLVFTPVFQVVPAPQYDLEKTVDKTTAKPGDTISYTINVKNTGNVNLNNVKVTDKLPAYYSEAKETITSKNGSTGSIVKGGELTFKKLNVGETATIKISYKIKDADQLECGDTKITNKATAITDEDTTEGRTDNNEVTTTVDKDCTPVVPPVEKKPGYDVSKTVDKTTAKPGDTIKYTIKVANTGEVELTNVVVTDQLPAYYAKADEKVTSQNGSTGSIVKDGKITFKKLNVGETAAIEVTYQLKAADQFDCGTTTVKNKATGTTDQDQTEDKTDNNEVTTDVNKECKPEEPKTPAYDLIKTVDKTEAKLGDTLTYTLTFKNTGETDLTDVTIKDTLPAGLTVQGKVTTKPETKVSGDLFKDGLKIAKVEKGKSIQISFTAKVTAKADDLQCGENKFTNTASSTTKEDQTEDKTGNNSATTTVNKECNPVTPPTPEEPENPQTPQTPTVIAQTGAGETIATIIGLGAIAAATTFYIRSRKLS